MESHIPSRLQGGELVLYSFRTCLSQNFFDQGVNEWVECNIASGVRLLWHERNQVVFNGKRFDVSNVKSKFVQVKIQLKLVNGGQLYNPFIY